MPPASIIGRFVVLAAKAGVIKLFFFLGTWTGILTPKWYMGDISPRWWPYSFPLSHLSLIICKSRQLCCCLQRGKAAQPQQQKGYFSHVPKFFEIVDFSIFFFSSYLYQQVSTESQCLASEIEEVQRHSENRRIDSPISPSAHCILPSRYTLSQVPLSPGKCFSLHRLTLSLEINNK